MVTSPLLENYGGILKLQYQIAQLKFLDGWQTSPFLERGESQYFKTGPTFHKPKLIVPSIRKSCKHPFSGMLWLKCFVQLLQTN